MGKEKYPTIILETMVDQTIYDLGDHEALLRPRTNQVTQASGLITYMRHIFDSFNSGPDCLDDPFHPLTRDEWETHTATQRGYL